MSKITDLGRRLLDGAKARLARTSRVLIVGMILFAVGFGLSLFRSRPAGDEEDGTQVSLVGSINSFFERVGSNLVPGPTEPATRMRFSLLLVSMLSEGLSPDARDTLATGTEDVQAYFGHVFALPALVTLVLAFVGYVTLCHVLDRKLERSEAAPEATEQAAGTSDSS